MRVPRRVEPVKTIAWLGERFRREHLGAANRQPAPLDPWHNVGEGSAPAFGQPESLPGTGQGAQWHNYGGDYNPLSFCIDGMGMVHLRGEVENLVDPGSFTPPFFNTTLFQFPPGYRPDPAVEVSINHLTNTSGANDAQVTIWPDGHIQVLPGFTWATRLNFDGVRFLAIGPT